MGDLVNFVEFKKKKRSKELLKIARKNSNFNYQMSSLVKLLDDVTKREKAVKQSHRTWKRKKKPTDMGEPNKIY